MRAHAVAPECRPTSWRTSLATVSWTRASTVLLVMLSITAECSKHVRLASKVSHVKRATASWLGECMVNVCSVLRGGLVVSQQSWLITDRCFQLLNDVVTAWRHRAGAGDVSGRHDVTQRRVTRTRRAGLQWWWWWSGGVMWRSWSRLKLDGGGSGGSLVHVADQSPQLVERPRLHQDVVLGEQQCRDLGEFAHWRSVRVRNDGAQFVQCVIEVVHSTPFTSVDTQSHLHTSRPPRHTTTPSAPPRRAATSSTSALSSQITVFSKTIVHSSLRPPPPPWCATHNKYFESLLIVEQNLVGTRLLCSVVFYRHWGIYMTRHRAVMWKHEVTHKTGSTLCLKKTTMTFYAITSIHINRFW